MAADLFLHQLAETEAQLDTLTQLLLKGDAPAYEAGAAALRLAIAQLAQASSGLAMPLPSDQAQRLQQMARVLARQRDQLARRAVVVDRTLSAVLPHKQPTYQAPGRGAGFGAVAPRIYSAPAR